MRTSRSLVGAACAAAALTACLAGGGGTPTGEAELDVQLAALILEHGLTGRPELLATNEGENLPRLDDPLVELGKRLFFTRSLGGNFTSTCASCHHPLLAGGDALTLPVGVDAVDPARVGPGRQQAPGAAGYDGGPNVPRNSPTTFNSVLYRKALFWDGRVRRNPLDGGILTPDSAGPTASDPDAGPSLLAAQARFPVTSEEEMRSFDFEINSTRAEVRAHLAGRLGHYGAGVGEIPDSWLPLFRRAFDQPAGTAQDLIHFGTINLALAAYQASQLFVDNPWNRYVLGETKAISTAAKRGALLFFRTPAHGGAGCAACHSGDFFTDEDFHILAMPQVGRGKGDVNELGEATGDFGRWQVTGDARDKFAFRTPTLLNAEVSAPYGHDGAYDALADVIRHHLDPVGMAANYYWPQTDPGTQVSSMIQNTGEAVAALLAARAQGRSLLPTGVALTNQDLGDLLAFMKALTDARVKSAAALEPWVARDDAQFTDSQLLDASFQN